MLAVRENRYIVLAKDFEKAYKTVIKKDEQEHEFYKWPHPYTQDPGTSLTSPTSVLKPSSFFSLPRIDLFNKHTRLNPFNFFLEVLNSLVS